MHDAPPAASMPASARAQERKDEGAAVAALRSFLWCLMAPGAAAGRSRRTCAGARWEARSVFALNNISTCLPSPYPSSWIHWLRAKMRTHGRSISAHDPNIRLPLPGLLPAHNSPLLLHRKVRKLSGGRRRSPYIYGVLGLHLSVRSVTSSCTVMWVTFTGSAVVQLERIYALLLFRLVPNDCELVRSRCDSSPTIARNTSLCMCVLFFDTPSLQHYVVLYWATRTDHAIQESLDGFMSFRCHYRQL
ncbi:hypothetical protein EDB89DRAFT_1394822 [Lactarius sanguifluus]|nr:hypothetical protein EDB89DRAFT_1394822 [Lactarius sanguifluus]